MQAEEYNRRGKELVDYITQYLGSIRERRVIPDVKPGYMKELLPDTAPTEPEDWETIFNDIEKVVMPGVVHWQSPHMHAYYPSLTSWPSMLGDMLADAINCVGFTWASSPACTELEMNVMDWLCKALGLPSFFLHQHPDSRGGGILQSTVSESTLVALLAARKDKILQLRAELDQEVDDSVLNSRLVAYASDQAHSSVEKAGLISLVKIRFLPTDEQLTGGYNEGGLWLHVDAAYAGSAYFCPELRWSLEGIDFAHSFVFNPSKWMMVHFDCTAFWVKDKYKLQQTFSVDPVYLRHENSQAATDFMDHQIRIKLASLFTVENYDVANTIIILKFQNLNVYFFFCCFQGIEMAKLLESHIRRDPNFEVPAARHLGLVVFCLKGGNALTQELLRRLTRSGTMYLIPADIHTTRIIRFTVTSQFTTADDILKDWGIISKTASTLLAETQGPNNSDQSKAGEDDVMEAEENQDPNSDTRSDEKEDAASMLDKAQVELWIDKAWNRSRRPMRSLSCNSALPTPSTPASSPLTKVTEMPSNLLGKQVLKKLTKFYSVPSFCNQWVQCGRHPLCCPLKVSQAAQKHLSSTCRRMNCMSSSPIANTAPSPTPLETATAPKLL
uniref:Histidine decarboxylase n=1 Tax=Seriola dumerili TaxID=41447 RepID=A0A3B4TEP5_SERDU